MRKQDCKIIVGKGPQDHMLKIQTYEPPQKTCKETEVCTQGAMTSGFQITSVILTPCQTDSVQL